MDNVKNETQVSPFLFSGLTNDGRLTPFLFLFFFFVYIVTVIGNIGMIAIVKKTTKFNTPMYFFLSYLSLVDLFYSTVITPRMLSDLISSRRVISFNGCAIQFFLFAALAGTEIFILANMSYDRYVAICHPLHYASIITKSKCFCLVLLAFFIGFLQSALQANCVFRLQFCRSHLIDHFYCDVPPLLKLSCSDTLYCDLVTVYSVGACTIGSFLPILISYMFIFSTIIRMKSAEGKQKAFSTCSAHLICTSLFYVTVFFTYLRPPSDIFDVQDKVACIFYTVLTPMLNPLVYSLRNQEVKKIVLQAVCHSTVVKTILSVIRKRVNNLPKLLKLRKVTHT
ncbi:olfactory receptor 5B12-like [Bufo gargarizans]|uniref:olfactory receptor 5B12-like n=1 Tax=Bufo gargarizans TaxID=30331 RepID=UPI001CF25F94|nr:olfactory receptor 5B12-like [Bufo gargarizans]